MNNRSTVLILSAVLIAAMVSGCVQEILEIEAPQPNVTPPTATPDATQPTPTPEATSPSGEPIAPFRQHLSFSDTPALNQTADITCTLVANGDIPNTSVRIMLPEGIVFIDSDGTWTGSLSKNETAQFNATIKVVKTGNWTIRVSNAAGCVYVLSASENTASISELTLLEWLYPTAANGDSIPDDIKIGNATPPGGQIVEPYFPIYVGISFSEAPPLNQTATLTCTLASEIDVPGIHAQATVPPGLLLMSGNTSWQGDIVGNETVEFSMVVKSVKIGTWLIDVDVRSISDGSIKGEGMMYLSVSEHSAAISPGISVGGRQ